MSNNLPLTLISSVVGAAGAIVNWYKDIDRNPDALVPIQDISLIEFRKRIKNMESAIAAVRAVDKEETKENE